MYGRHLQHHLVYQKFLHFPYPEIFDKPHLREIKIIQNNNAEIRYRTNTLDFPTCLIWIHIVAYSYLAVQDELNKLFLIDPMNPVYHDQARKNPPRAADVKYATKSMRKIKKWSMSRKLSLNWKNKKIHWHQEVSQDDH